MARKEWIFSMKVTLIQPPKTQTLKWLENLSLNGDVAILPELFYSDWDHLEQASQQESQVMACLTKLSANINLVGGSLVHTQDGIHYNTCPIFYQGKLRTKVDKLHLMAFQNKIDEADFFSPGKDLVMIEMMDLYRTSVQVCFDIRYPEPTRLLTLAGMQVLFVPAAFHTKVIDQFRHLLCARAIENQIFVVGCNAYGHSMIIDPAGHILYEMDEQPGLATIELDMNRLKVVRDRSPLLKRRRKDKYEIRELLD